MLVPLLFLVVSAGIMLAWTSLEDRRRLMLARTILISEFFIGLMVVYKVYAKGTDKALFVLNSVVFGAIIIGMVLVAIKNKITRTPKNKVNSAGASFTSNSATETKDRIHN